MKTCLLPGARSFQLTPNRESGFFRNHRGFCSGPGELAQLAGNEGLGSHLIYEVCFLSEFVVVDSATNRRRADRAPR
jgi:hypothetical protein